MKSTRPNMTCSGTTFRRLAPLLFDRLSSVVQFLEWFSFHTNLLDCTWVTNCENHNALLVKGNEICVVWRKKFTNVLPSILVRFRQHQSLTRSCVRLLESPPFLQLSLAAMLFWSLVSRILIWRCVVAPSYTRLPLPARPVGGKKLCVAVSVPSSELRGF